MSEPVTRERVWWVGVLGVALVSFVLHLAVVGRYGYFRDELYYLSNAARLDWGYVDHPPFSIFVLRMVTEVLGTDLWAVRAGALGAGFGLVVLYGFLAAEAGAGKGGQVLAAGFAAGAPVLAVVTHLYSMNSWDVLFWAGAGALWWRASERRGLWLWLGLVLGLAVLNKWSGLWLMAGLGLGTLLTERRGELRDWRPWAALGIAALVASPHFVWQQANGWPTLEFIENARAYKMVETPPWLMLGVQLVVTNPVLALVWVVGWVVAWGRREWRPWGVAFTVVFLIIAAGGRSRENYLSPAYAFVVPLGASVFGRWLGERRGLAWGYGGLAVASSGGMLTFALPVLPPPVFLDLVSRVPLALPQAQRGEKSPMQGHADQFGWEEMAREVRLVWESLPEAERGQTPVFGVNYGQSSAVWFFNQGPGGDGGGPDVIGQHNQFWLWGPGDWDGGTLIVVGQFSERKRRFFERVEVVRRLDLEFAVPEEASARVWVARGLRVPVSEFWRETQHFQ